LIVVFASVINIPLAPSISAFTVPLSLFKVKPVVAESISIVLTEISPVIVAVAPVVAIVEFLSPLSVIFPVIVAAPTSKFDVAVVLPSK
jgi:hypothetical protein